MTTPSVADPFERRRSSSAPADAWADAVHRPRGHLLERSSRRPSRTSTSWSTEAGGATAATGLGAALVAGPRHGRSHLGLRLPALALRSDGRSSIKGIDISDSTVAPPSSAARARHGSCGHFVQRRVWPLRRDRPWLRHHHPLRPHDPDRWSRRGTWSSPGQLVGTHGTARGRVTGVHLHFEVRIDGHAVDPMDFLPQP